MIRLGGAAGLESVERQSVKNGPNYEIKQCLPNGLITMMWGLVRNKGTKARFLRLSPYYGQERVHCIS